MTSLHCSGLGPSHAHVTPVSQDCWISGLAVALHCVGDTGTPSKPTHCTFLYIEPSPQSLSLMQPDQGDTCQINQLEGHSTRLHGRVVLGLTNPALTHTLSATTAVLSIHTGGSRVTIPKVEGALGLDIHCAEQEDHTVVTSQYAIVQGAVLQAWDVTGCITPLQGSRLLSITPS